VNSSVFVDEAPDRLVSVTHCLGFGGAFFATVSVIERPDLRTSTGDWAITIPGVSSEICWTVLTFQS
jgi:hypothetical protein